MLNSLITKPFGWSAHTYQNIWSLRLIHWKQLLFASSDISAERSWLLVVQNPPRNLKFQSCVPSRPTAGHGVRTCAFYKRRLDSGYTKQDDGWILTLQEQHYVLHNVLYSVTNSISHVCWQCPERTCKPALFSKVKNQLILMLSRLIERCLCYRYQWFMHTNY